MSSLLTGASVDPRNGSTIIGVNAMQNATDLVACVDCDALINLNKHYLGQCHCFRCGAYVPLALPQRQNSPLAWYVTSLVFFSLANSFPVVTIEAGGETSGASILGAAWALWSEQRYLISILVLLTTVAIPSVDLLVSLLLLVRTRARRASPLIFRLFRLREVLRPWNMVEIFVLGALIAMVKLSSLARIEAGVGLWSLGAFMITHAAAVHAFDPIAPWQQMEKAT